MEKKSVKAMEWRGSTPGHFTGEVRICELNEPVPGGPRTLMVTFQPGARTNWHTHPGGQVLHVVSGEGQVCNADGERVSLLPGDVVTIPPGELHWHGASPGSPMSHLSVTDAPAAWTGSDVTDEEYLGA